MPCFSLYLQLFHVIIYNCSELAYCITTKLSQSFSLHNKAKKDETWTLPERGDGEGRWRRGKSFSSSFPLSRWPQVRANIKFREISKIIFTSEAFMHFFLVNHTETVPQPKLDNRRCCVTSTDKKHPPQVRASPPLYHDSQYTPGHLYFLTCKDFFYSLMITACTLNISSWEGNEVRTSISNLLSTASSLRRINRYPSIFHCFNNNISNITKKLFCDSSRTSTWWTQPTCRSVKHDHTVSVFFNISIMYFVEVLDFKLQRYYEI